MFLKKISSIVSSVVIAVTSLVLPVSSESRSYAEMRNISTMQLVRDMGIGINLGNTYESCGDWISQWGNGTVESYETAWGSPVITQKIIQGYAQEGFGVLRVPVAWSNMMGDDYTINTDYLKAIKEVTDWALESGMYVILNIHYDNGWFSGFSTNKNECMYKYSRIWNQLSDAFKDYGDYLMFESLNEEGCWDDIWNKNGGSTANKKKAFDLLNEINQKFVDIVRNSGGNNPKRHLLIAGYATDVKLTCDSLFKMPEDPQRRCAVSVHYYTPSVFAILEEDASWGDVRKTWGTEADFKELNYYMDLMKKTYIDKGIPVIIGEFGCPKKNKEENSVRLFLKSVCEAAYSRQMCPVLWDITGLHYDRSTFKMIDQQLKSDFMNILESTNLRGDISGNGEIDLYDAIEIAKYMMGLVKFNNEQLYIADFDGNGVVDLYDAIGVAKHIMGII